MHGYGGPDLKITRCRSFLSATLLLLALTRATAVPAQGSVPENYEIRAKFRDLIFGSRNAMSSFRSTIEQLHGRDSAVSLQVQNQNDSFYLLFTNEEACEYPVNSPGSYVIKRDMDSGDLLQIRSFSWAKSGHSSGFSHLATDRGWKCF